MKNNNEKSPNFENRDLTTFIHIFPLNSTLFVGYTEGEILRPGGKWNFIFDKWNFIFDRSFPGRLKLAKPMIKIFRYNTKCLPNIFSLKKTSQL